MKALVKLSDGISVKEMPMPKISSSEVLIKVSRAGICGTDVAIYRGQFKAPVPLIMGHEFAGIVVDGDKNIVGKRVTAEINIGCGRCYFCRRGMSIHCLRRKALGITTNGCFAEYMKIPSLNIHEIPISFEEGTFVEPLAAAIQLTKKTPISLCKNVLVLGCGRLGLLIIQVLRMHGANVFAYDRNDFKTKLAASFGAKIISPGEADLPFFDVVVECTGNPEVMNLAIELVKPTGTIALKSTPGIPSNVNLHQVVVNEVNIQGSRCGTSDLFDMAISIIRDGKGQVKKLISNRFNLEEYKEAFESKGIKNIFTIEC